MSEENAYEYFNTELIITSDSINDIDNSKIMDAIRRIYSSINSVSHTAGTNVISVSGKWSESDLVKIHNKICKIPGVHIKVGKKQRVVVRSPSPEHVSVSENAGWSVTKDVIADIFRDIEARKYFRAIMTSCQYFNVLGKKLLGIKKDDYIQLSHLINRLHFKNIIDEKISSKMHNIREYRNPIEHEGAGFQYNADQVKEAEVLALAALGICKLLESEKKRIDRLDLLEAIKEENTKSLKKVVE